MPLTGSTIRSDVCSTDTIHADRWGSRKTLRIRTNVDDTQTPEREQSAEPSALADQRTIHHPASMNIHSYAVELVIQQH